jgi:hypothetical protein
MALRREIYLEDSDDQLLQEQSRKTGISINELILRAIRQFYDSGQRLSWDVVFGSAVEAKSAVREPWIYDDLFDTELTDSTSQGSGRESA